MTLVTQYFAPAPGGLDDSRVLTLLVKDRLLDLRTDAAVFSRGRIDPGTMVLLDRVPVPPAEGTFLDLGCGYGPIALSMATRSPEATVWAIDVNERARRLCAANATAAGLHNVRVAAPDEVPSDVRFALIWSNPPIRIGKGALHELLARWLGRLEPAGEAFLVVQRHLGSDSLQRWLTGQGWSTTRLTSRKSFRVLHCTALGSG